MAGYATPSGSCGQQSATDFWTWRWMGGTIRARLLDVALAPDPNYNWGQWGQAQLRIDLVGRDGGIKASNSLYKSWGVLPAYKTFVFWNNAQEVRMRIRASVYSYPWGAGAWVNFKMEWSWG
ncbi:hypothetical protein SEA_YUUY_26 [Microbacterium phage YuuY]|nr:hypothetical protein SEA_YUUY_26 [Microbacterium phage YuuY]